MSFTQYYQCGCIGESEIAAWLRSRGFSVLPVYELEIQRGKGPRLFAPSGELIAPDMVAYKGDKCLWIEAKHKTAFSWHRRTQQWVTGIDLRHYRDYCLVDDNSPWPVWLLFLHRGGQAKDSPPESPAGLYGNALSYLRKHESHRHQGWGKTGMVYWGIAHLRPLATLQEVVRETAG